MKNPCCTAFLLFAFGTTLAVRWPVGICMHGSCVDSASLRMGLPLFRRPALFPYGHLLSTCWFMARGFSHKV